MIIDTYVYFVSYRYKEYDIMALGVGQSTVTRDIIIKDGYNVAELTKFLKEENKFENIIIINFQLLDSYNKEEREGKESE
jgi:hypothetical protein